MTEELHNSTGILKYFRGEGGGYKLILEIDQNIVEYYRSLMPKYIKTNKQMYSAHISVVRKEVPPNESLWGKYEGEEFPFTYGSTVYAGTVYYWINCFSVRLEETRLELGLPVSSIYTLPPEGFTRCFHCTIGNTKDDPQAKNSKKGI